MAEKQFRKKRALTYAVVGSFGGHHKFNTWFTNIRFATRPPTRWVIALLVGAKKKKETKRGGKEQTSARSSSTRPLSFLSLPTCVTAVQRASMDSMSKLLVGSSKKRTCGACRDSSQKTTRAFWPPERSRILMVWACPSSPNLPRRFLACW